MNLADIYAFPRDHLDLTVDDLPDSILAVFTREGHSRICEAEHRWPFFEKKYTFSSAPGTNEIALSSIGSDLRDVVTVQGDKWVLERIDHDQALATFPPTITNTREPNWFSQFNESLYLWPIPNGTYTYTLLGQRAPVDFVAQGAGGEPDLPTPFHELLAFWVLHRVYMHEDDLQNSQLYKTAFEEGLAEMRKRYLHAPLSRPIVLNRGRKLTPTLSPRLLFPFDNR